MTPLRSERLYPSSRGIQVPSEDPSARGYNVTPSVSLLTLVLPVASLYFFMHSFLHLSLQDSCSGWLVVASNFQNVGGVDIMVYPSSHNVMPIHIKFEDWDLQNERLRIEICAINYVGG